MDVYYASVGTAIDTNQTSKWQLPLVTGAAASFYSLTGASEKASQVVSKASRDLIQHAWYVYFKKVGSRLFDLFSDALVVLFLGSTKQ